MNAAATSKKQCQVLCQNGSVLQSEPSALPRLVQFDSRFIRQSLFAVSGLLLFSLVLIFLLVNSRPGLIWSLAIFGLALIYTTAPPYLVHFGRRMVTKEPAFVVYPEGLFIGLLIFEKLFLMPWKEIACVYEKDGSICILPADPTAFRRARPWWIRYIYASLLSKYGTMLATSPLAVDIDWDEFSGLVNGRVPIGTVSNGRISVPAARSKRPDAQIFRLADPLMNSSGEPVGDVLEYFKRVQSGPSEPLANFPEEPPKSEEEYLRIKAAFEGRLTLDGKLVTVDNFRNHFDRNLVGAWSTARSSAAPGDYDLEFREDGTGTISPAFFGEAGHFDWREAMRNSLEVRCKSVADYWFLITWTFTESSHPTLMLHDADPHDPTELPNTLSSMLGISFSYDGPPR